MHHFDPVTGLQAMLGMCAARHDVQVDLNRHTPPGQLHQLKQISQATAGC
jgi:hypothetical protein